MATTMQTLVQKLSETSSDWLEVATTTNIAGSSTVVLSTNLNAYDGAANTAFDDWWCLILGTANDAVERKIQTYATSGGSCTLFGANLAAESAAMNIRLGRLSNAAKQRAIVRAIEEIYPALYRPLEDRTLITGNILPNAHFEDQSTAGTPDKYTLSNVTGAAETSTIRGGAKSVKLTTTTAAGYLYISSDTWPRLLDLQGKTVSIKVWVYPEVADDPTMVIYTLQPDGTTQTLPTTTSAPAAKWTLLELENQTLNDDLDEVQIRFPIATNLKYVIFDDARVTGMDTYEYRLPTAFRNGHVGEVYVQTSGSSDDICDDLHPLHFERVYLSTPPIDDGTDKFLRLPTLYGKNRRIRLIGDTPLENLTAYASTISLDDKARIDMLIEYAAYLLFRTEGADASRRDVARFDDAANKHYGNYVRLLSSHRMSQRSTLVLPRIG